MLENHYTRLAQLLCVGCSQRVQRIVYQAVKRVMSWSIFNILKYSSHLNPVVYLLNKIYGSYVTYDAAPELCQELFLFLKKRMKSILFIF